MYIGDNKNGRFLIYCDKFDINYLSITAEKISVKYFVSFVLLTKIVTIFHIETGSKL